MNTSIGSWSCLRCADLVVAAAFEQKSYLRDPKQIATATDKPLEKVLEVFDTIFNGPSWRTEHYITAQDVFKYAEETKVSEYYYQGRMLVHAEVRDNKDELAIVFASWCGHLYFFKGAGAMAQHDAQKKAMQHTSPDVIHVKTHTLAKSAAHPPKAVESFEPYP